MIRLLLAPLMLSLGLPFEANKTLLIMEFGVEMNDIEECKDEGERWLASSGVRIKGQKPRLSYQCKKVIN